MYVKSRKGKWRSDRVIQLGNWTESKRDNPNAGRVYSIIGICPTLTSMRGGNDSHMFYYIATSRGRDPNNLSRRTQGGIFEQRLGLNNICNVLATVSKDNCVLEITNNETQTSNKTRLD